MPFVADVVDGQREWMGTAQRRRVGGRVKDVELFTADGARQIDERPAEVGRKNLTDRADLHAISQRGVGRCSKNDDRVILADPDEPVQELTRVPPHTACR